ncbi:MAG: hypothetical protein K0S32_4294 [Bacteroidetes bacterium]|jgi:hypothetical protein|nr:hypothetical protein [Bacteroidota bacterium]
MISENIHIDVNISSFDPEKLKKGTWIAILHAQRVPPHIGLIFDGNYNSLTIKEHELNINYGLLLKTILQKKIKSIFLKIVPHPVFSLNHQLEMFQEQLKQFGYVKQNETTCLSPVKTFFREFYAVCSANEELFFDFIQQLNNNDYIESASCVNMELKDGIDLPFYTIEELNERIRSERQPYYND